MKKIVIASIATLALVTVASAAVNTAKCMGCHGKSFEKNTMDKTKIPNKLNKANFEKALLGYANGSIKNPLMQNMVRGYKKEQLHEIAQKYGK